MKIVKFFTYKELIRAGAAKAASGNIPEIWLYERFMDIPVLWWSPEGGQREREDKWRE
jgi:hypothetical protein